MAGIGQLSAGIAHEINTPLGYVKSNLETLERYVLKLEGLYKLQQKGTDNYEKQTLEEYKTNCSALRDYIKDNNIEFIYSDLGDAVNESSRGLNKIDKIVKSLLGFSKRTETTNFVQYYINKGIKDTLVIANNEIKHYAKVNEDLEEVPYIMAIDGEVNQVILNMIINAVYAIKEKGEFGNITVHTYKEDDFVYCEIADDGMGISEDHLKRIFEPFFTTKPVGLGTGLGLSITYDIIVNKHGGHIEVESQIGKGTKFIIKLPIKQHVEIMD
ncbi:MAG TPA: histidine kinase [Clostridiales bacterium]|nr:MAG: hypothetical protein A2Y22_03135 [Clostridiales bacterium GWD2_32_59]HAN09614.1 histidine kinase [Clostridiales bacterium]